MKQHPDETNLTIEDLKRKLKSNEGIFNIKGK
jgi:hypothetical protein